MNNIEKMAIQLAKECNEKGFNFVIVIEDNGIHDQFSVNGKTALRELVEVLKKITKK